MTNISGQNPDKAYEKIIISNLDGQSPMSKALVFHIPPTIHEHNVITELLKRIRVDWPGAWYCVQEWERNMAPKAIGPVVAKVKAVSREHLGLPKEDTIVDIPL